MGVGSVRIDVGSLNAALRRMRESADGFGRHADTLSRTIVGDQRSPWGTGNWAMVMDQVNEVLVQNCRQIDDDLNGIGARIQADIDLYEAAEQANMTALGVATHARSRKFAS